MCCFALFRLPYEHRCSLLTGDSVEVGTLTALSGMSGFVVAPFAPSARHPVVMIRPDRQRVLDTVDDADLPDVAGLLAPLNISGSPDVSCLRAGYHADYSNFHAHLTNGDFQKLVLSRSVAYAHHGEEKPVELFRRACQRYPRLFVSLVFTPQSGLWLTATPEILLSGHGNDWMTIALAGTMPYADEVSWSEKNIQEQRYVAVYMMRQLQQFSADVSEQGPYTARAGHLAHLRSDFRFTMRDGTEVGRLLQALHPTPAVCGLPKEEAFRFILANEHHDRSYYSGLMGPLAVDGQTHLFVTLRCMQLFSNAYRLYAGGGLLTDSTEEQEWVETDIKLDTMRNLLTPPNSP